MTFLEQNARAPKAGGGSLVLENVTRVFSSRWNKVEALQPINLEVSAGEFVVFVGPSGCGKSTLLNLIAGLDKPTEGTILLDGKRLSKPGPNRLMMFQEHALFPWLSVIDNVAFGLRWKYRFQRAKRKQIARELLEMVHLAQFERSPIHQLSGGMKQRAALARALAPNPQLLLIDEPFPALDAITRHKLYGDIQEIFTKTQKTIISVTHDTREAACLGDRVVIFTGRPGRIKGEVRIDLPRPRDPNDPKVAEYAGDILKRLEIGDERTDDNSAD
jgi:NitT/TauT family transport system ATP-binding protein